MRMTGPTDAVELVRFAVTLDGRPFAWHRKAGLNGLGAPVFSCGGMVRCGYDFETVRASPADIRLGFIRSLCPECRDTILGADEA